MKDLLVRHISFLQVGLVGAVGAAIQAVLLYTFVEFIHAYPVVANILAAEAAIVSNFTFNNIWTFKQQSLFALPHRFALFNLSALGSIAIQTLVMWVGIYFFGVQLYLLYAIIGIGIGWVINYFVYSRFIWIKTHSTT